MILKILVLTPVEQNILLALSYLSSKLIETTKEIGMDLLQTFHAAWLKRVKQTAFKQSVSLLATLSVDGIVAVCKPVKKPARPVVGIMFGKNNNALAIEHICLALLAIRSLEFEPVSGTHELDSFLFELTLKPTPIVSAQAEMSVQRLSNSESETPAIG